MISKVPHRKQIRRLAQWRKPQQSMAKRVATDALVSGSAASVASAAMDGV
jgi:hypothetical protein